MTYAIDSQIETFLAWRDQLADHGAVEDVCDYGFVLRPRGAAPAALASGHDIALTLMGLTHGNEWAGVAVLNRVLAHVAAGAVALTAPIAFALGNPWAARENRRFLERDLNRAFARAEPAAREERRAAELGRLLGRSRTLVDFHQTARPSDRPFFIFPFSRESLALARAVCRPLTVVTHWGRSFSSEGLCSDEYVNRHGGTGITIELGQNGFDPYQIAVGVDAALGAIAQASRLWQGAPAAPLSKPLPGDGDLYTWATIVPWPERGFIELAPGLDNFQPVTAGQELGQIDGEPLRAPMAGRILFPKYLSRAQQEKQESRPTELVRLLRPVVWWELPLG